MAVKVPATYTEEYVTIRIAKGNVFSETTWVVSDGFSIVDFDGYVPDGFINGYGSPMYEVTLVNPTTGEIVELQSSGDPVTSVIFQLVSGQTSETTITITY